MGVGGSYELLDCVRLFFSLGNGCILWCLRAGRVVQTVGLCWVVHGREIGYGLCWGGE